MGAPALLLVWACADPTGPLDEEVLIDLAREQGDAEGYAWTGSYRVETATPLECTCPAEVVGVEGTCGLSPPEGVWLQVVQADGQVSIDPHVAAPAIGPLDMDGTFSAGSVSFTNLLLGRIQARWRFDGTFTEELEDPDDSASARAVMTGTFAIRLKGTAVVNPDGETTEPLDVDCGESVELRVVR